MTALPARGEVWWCKLPEAGPRPIVVLSRDAAIRRLRPALIDAVESVAIAALVERLGRLGDERTHRPRRAAASHGLTRSET